MRDNVWFTYKARIKAHERLEWMDFHSQNLLVWYAILSAVVAILSIRYPGVLGKDTDLLAAVLSVFLVALSLSVTNRDFRGRALLMRSNYQKLHGLYRRASKDMLSPSETDEYEALLRDCENHKAIDDVLSRVFSENLTSRKPTCREYFWGWSVIFFRNLLAASLYVAPLVIFCFVRRCV